MARRQDPDRGDFSRQSSEASLGSVEEAMAKTAVEYFINGETTGGGGEEKKQQQQVVRFKNDQSLDSSGGELGVVIQEFLCPLSGELPIDPCTAMDGSCYERTAILKWIEGTPRDELISPVTRKPMGNKIFPATQVRNAIERSVKSGAISGPKVERWVRRIEMEEEIEEARKLAGQGDTDAMYHLGVWHQCGKKGMRRNIHKAFDWYKRSADGGNIRGMAAMGFLLVKGEGTKCNKVEGVALVTFAATEQGGVDAAAYCLANWYNHGLHGLPKSEKWAMFWLNRVVSGTCSIRDMDEKGVERAQAQLDKLQKNALSSLRRLN